MSGSGADVVVVVLVLDGLVVGDTDSPTLDGVLSG